MKSSFLLIAALVTLAFVALTVSPRDGSAQATTIDTASDYFCAPSFENSVCETTVVVGSTVTWQVSGGVHTVTQCDASFTTCPPPAGFDSGLLNDGGTFAQTFNSAGVIPYFCAFHPDQMRGRILVQAQTTATPALTASPGVQTPSQPRATSVPGTTASTPAQVPASGGPPSGGFPWVAMSLGVALVGASVAAGTSALAVARRRED